MTLFPLTDCCDLLAVDPKTLRQWLKHAAMSLQTHPTDARVKCLTLPQVQQLAGSHGRTLQLHLVPPLGSGGSSAGCGESQPLPLPVCPSQADLQRQLVSLQAQVMVLQQQLAHLTSLLLLGPQTTVPQIRASLAALLPATGSLQPSSPARPQQGESSHAESGPRPHPAENRRRPLLPLIEYGASGNYVVICPKLGELQLLPDSPEWFAWLASVSSFRFVGKCGRFTACRVYDKGPTRAFQAHRYIHQHLYKPHLGVTECLTIDRLEQAAAKLQSYVDSR